MSEWKTHLSLPSEGLALFRRGLGLLCVLDSLLRISGVQFYLSDIGVLPRSQYFRFFEDSLTWSIYLISGRPEVATFLLLATAGLGLLHLCGKSFRWSRIALWVLLLSVQNRHPGILDSTDDLIRLMAFWDIFLPEFSEKNRDWLTPATVGWQVQFTLVCIFTGLSMQRSNLLQACQWSDAEQASMVAAMSLYLKVALFLLALAVWLAPLRLVAMLVFLLAGSLWAYLLHPLAPLTIFLAGLSLCRSPKRKLELADANSRKWEWGLVVVVSVVILALNILESKPLRRPFVAVGEFTGLLQTWDRTYPLSASSVVELVARSPRQEQVIWTLTSESGRRDRLFAQRVGENLNWGSNLARALAFESGQPGQLPVIWMRVEELKKSFRLGGSDLFLVSSSPVSVDTRRKLKP